MKRNGVAAPRSRLKHVIGDRLRVVYGLLLVAEVGVLLLAWQSARAIQRQREIVGRNLVEFANFGATSFAYRAGSIFANHARIMNQSLAGLGDSTNAGLLRSARLLLDSVDACRCESALPVQRLTLLNAQGRVVQTFRTDTTAPYSIPWRALDGMMVSSRSAPSPDFVVRLTDEGDELAVLALVRIAATGAGGERFLLTHYALQSVRDRMFGYIYNSRPTLLPSMFGSERRNDATIALRVVLPGGAVLYESPNARDVTFTASVHFGPDPDVRVQAVLMPAIAREFLQAADSANRSGWVGLVTFVASLVIALIALLTRRAAQLATLRGDFTAAVSHELRTPLTEIMLYAELILAGKTVGTMPTNTAAQIILAEARRLYNLVENVLVVARTDRRMLRVRLGPHDLVPVVRDTITGFGPLADKRRVHIVQEVSPTCTALCDPSAVAGILNNLLENAVRYGPEAQVVIVRVLATSAAVAVIEVDDAGPGIPMSDRQRVCEPYIRLARDVDANTSGSGLGLAVVSALLGTMHGELEIQSSTRGGTRMRVLLPLA
ncbi:MAG: HAMP domain-containing sensor histidine kinase [Gemmatimonadota bacterium]